MQIGTAYGRGGEGMYGTPIQNSINAARPYANRPVGPTQIRPIAAPYRPPLQGPTQINPIMAQHQPLQGPTQINPIMKPYHPNPYGSPPAGTPPGMIGAPALPTTAPGPIANPPMGAPAPGAGTYLPQPTSGAVPPPPIVPGMSPFGPTAGLQLRQY
jgi:WAS family protein 2